MNFYFGYEKTVGDKWSPVLYHGTAPTVKDGWIVNSNGARTRCTHFVTITGDEEPPFGILQKMYPPPQEENNETS